MEAVNQKLQAAEDRRKQMVSTKGSQELAQVNDRFPNEELDFSFNYDATTIVKHEDLWSSDYETVSAMPNNMWSDVGNYEYPEFGTPGG
ncbi:hypothetical protein Hanom_Chr00s000919g01670191 [Helianthus anomalus]